MLYSVSNLFGISKSSCQCQEDFEAVSIEILQNSITIPSESEIRNALNSFPSRDLVHCDVVVDDGDPVSFHSKQPEGIPAFLANLKDNLAAGASVPSVKFTFSIDKKVVDEKLTIYSFKTFSDFLAGLSLKRLLNEFGGRLNTSDKICLVCADNILEFNTETIWFLNINSTGIRYTSNFNRSNILAKRNEVCHFENSSVFKSIPDDFFLQKRSESDDLNRVFDKLCAVASVCCIADISRIDGDDDIFYKINGYKAIAGNLNWKNQLPTVNDTHFKIYQWIYEGGIVNDKIGLARNLISLHTKGGNLFDLDDGILVSIRSGYQIYLKDNVEQYIKIKNNLIEYVTELSKKAAKLGEDLAESLSKNFVAFVSFFLSVVILKSISEKDLSVSFSPQLAVIAYTLLCASLIHFVVTVLLLDREISQMGKAYSAIKIRYADLLDQKDLENAFNRDSEYNLILDNIRFKRYLYGGAWIAHLAIFCLVVTYLLGVADKPNFDVPRYKSTNLTRLNRPISVFFSPNGGCLEAITNSLNAATNSILVQGYSFTSEPIAQALVDAKRRGVNVGVILDKSQETAKSSKAYYIQNAGISTYIDSKHAIAHNKIIVIDGSVVLTGSFNYSSSAEQKNAENLILIRDSNLAQQFATNWVVHLNHSGVLQAPTNSLP